MLSVPGAKLICTKDPLDMRDPTPWLLRCTGFGYNPCGRMNQVTNNERERLVKCLIFVGPVAIRNAFKLAVIDRILLEDIAEGAFETLSESSLVLLGLKLVVSIFTRPRFGLMVRGRPVAGRSAGHRARQSL